MVTTTTRQVVRFTRQLFSETLSRRQSHKAEFKTVQSAFWTKAWLIHCVNMFSRVLFPLLGVSYWQTAYKGQERFADKINVDFVEQIRPYIVTAIISLIPVGVILDIVAWRRREFAGWIFYYELVSNLVQAFVPFDYGDFRSVTILMVIMTLFV